MYNRNFFIFSLVLGMVSLYSTVSLSVARLIILKFNDTSGLMHSDFPYQSTKGLTMIWFLALLIAVPPLLGFGRYGQNMVVVR